MARSDLPASPSPGATIERVEFMSLRAANIARQAAWCPDQVPDLSFRGDELGSEVGEALNVIKKLERERHGWRGSRDTAEHLAEELADVVICADLVAITAGIDLDQAVQVKFNGTSEKVGLPHRLSLASGRAAAGVADPWVDTRLVRFDDTIVWGNGGFDFDAWESLRWEMHVPGAGSYAVWPNGSHGKSKRWSFYGGPDGVLSLERYATEAEAREDAQAYALSVVHAVRLSAAPEPQAAPAASHRGAPIATDDPGYHCPRCGLDDCGVREAGTLYQAAGGLDPEAAVAALSGSDAPAASPQGRGEVGEIEADLDVIERQVRITGEYDRGETVEKYNAPGGTTVEISLSHVTDAVKRIRDRLAALRAVPAPRALAVDETDDLDRVVRGLVEDWRNNRRYEALPLYKLYDRLDALVAAADAALARPREDRGAALDAGLVALSDRAALVAAVIADIEARVRPTICQTLNGEGHSVVEGRIWKADFEYLLLAIGDATVRERERCASLHESVNPASDRERLDGDPGAGAMAAVLEYRDLISGGRK